MGPTGRIFATTILLASLCPAARAQFATPAQGPAVGPRGVLTVYPSLGVVAGDNDHDDVFGDIESFHIAPRLRYNLADGLQLDGHLGGMFGDYNAFAIGGGLRYQFLRQAPGTPVNLAGFFNLDFAVGEVDHRRTDLDLMYFTMLTGVLVGHTFEAQAIDLSPYFGLGLGFTLAHADLPAPADDTETELAFDILFGFDIGITETVTVFTEFNLGPTDGMPLLVWHLGLAFRV